jgi:porin
VVLKTKGKVTLIIYSRSICLWMTLLAFASFSSFAFNPLAEIDISHDNPTDQDQSKPISLELLYIGDEVTGFSGPLESQWRYVDDTLFNINFDNSKLLKLHGNSVFISFLAVAGGAPNLVVNSPLGIDNIESYYRTFKLYQAYMQQELYDSKLSILAGLYDVNSEFYVTDSSLLFILPAFGTGAEFAQTGANGPSIFPTTAVATRIKIAPNENLYGMLGIMDGVSGNPDHQYGTQILMNKQDGLLLIGELGTLFGGDNKQYKFALGAWGYTAATEQLLQPPVDDSNLGISETPIIKKRNQGASLKPPTSATW